MSETETRNKNYMNIEERDMQVHLVRQMIY